MHVTTAVSKAVQQVFVKQILSYMCLFYREMLIYMVCCLYGLLIYIYLTVIGPSAFTNIAY